MSDQWIRVPLAGIVLGKPNRNGRIYPSKEFRRELDDRVASKQLMVVVATENAMYPPLEVMIKDCIGIVKSWEDDGEHVFIHVFPTDRESFDLDTVEFVPRGLGRIGSNHEVTDYRMLCICAVPKTTPERITDGDG